MKYHKPLKPFPPLNTDEMEALESTLFEPEVEEEIIDNFDNADDQNEEEEHEEINETQTHFAETQH